MKHRFARQIIPKNYSTARRHGAGRLRHRAAGGSYRRGAGHPPCVKDVPPTPTYEFDKLPWDAPAGVKVLALARDWLRGRQYEGQLESTIAGCSQR